MQTLYVKIPTIRIGALIGKDGKDKKELEELSNSRIIVNSQTGDVEITSKEANPVVFYKLELVVKAIGRGFAPEKAKVLLADDTTLIIINLTNLHISTKKTLQTRKGRVIGAEGSVHKFLEDKLDCYVSVQGKTISIIGRTKEAQICQEAIKRLLDGANIPTVKMFIQKAVKSGFKSFEYEPEEEQESDILD